MLHEHDGADDDRQPYEREHTSAPVFSQGPLRRLGRCVGGSPALQHYPQHPHRLGDVLDRLLAEVLVAQRELVPELIVGGARDADATRVGQTLEARSDIYAVAVDLLAVDDHVARIDADAEFHPPLGGKTRVLSLERGLNVDRALDRIHDAGKLGQYAIAGGIDEASAMLLDQRIDEFAMRGEGEGAVSRLFVLPHE